MLFLFCALIGLRPPGLGARSSGDGLVHRPAAREKGRCQELAMACQASTLRGSMRFEWHTIGGTRQEHRRRKTTGQSGSRDSTVKGCVLILDTGAHGHAVGPELRRADGVLAVVLEGCRGRVVEQDGQPIQRQLHCNKMSTRGHTVGWPSSSTRRKTADEQAGPPQLVRADQPHRKHSGKITIQ